MTAARAASTAATRSLPRRERAVLVCGDGDLSYSASISSSLARDCAKLVATVLEPAASHARIYRDSEVNVERIKDQGHAVVFGVDATRLRECDDILREVSDNYGEGIGGNEGDIERKVFDRIQFNFPHWRGKTNIRRNRTLLRDFFSSTTSVLRPGGQVHLALFDRQGGAYAKSLDDWRMSWMPARYAAEQDLVLVDVYPYEPEYKLSSYQWKDRPFHMQDTASMYVFQDVSDGRKASVPQELRLYSYFNLYIVVPPEEDEGDLSGNDDRGIVAKATTEEVLNEAFVGDLLQPCLPDGIRAEARLSKILDGNEMKNPVDCTIAIYQIIFFGDGRPLTFDAATKYRSQVEDEVEKRMTRWHKSKWRSSNVCPISLISNFAASMP